MSSLKFLSHKKPHLKIRIAPEARHSAFISIDGRGSTELTKSRELVIVTSEYSLPTITKEDQDWFSTLQVHV